jgi:hypothetical protein
MFLLISDAFEGVVNGTKLLFFKVFKQMLIVPGLFFINWFDFVVGELTGVVIRINSIYWVLKTFLSDDFGYRVNYENFTLNIFPLRFKINDSFLFFNLLENLKGVCAEVLSPGYVRCKLVVYVVVGVRLVDESFGQSAESELVILNNVSAQVARINSLQLEN